MYKDLVYWNKQVTNNALNSVSKGSPTQKLAYFLASKDLGDERASFESHIKGFYLLEERYKYIKSLMSSPEKIIHALDTHKQRVEWQIRRIYRARNMIVHEGITPTYTDILIENTHDYLDTILSGLMELASRKNTLNSIEQGFKMVEINYSSYHKQLKVKGLSFTKENLNALLFDYPL